MSWACVALLTLSAPASGQATSAPTSSNAGVAAPIDFSAARQLVLDGMAKDSVPAVAVAIARGDSILWEEGFGYANRETGVATTVHTPFYLASVTKTITATAAMVLHERGLLDLDRPASVTIPNSLTDPLGRTRDGASGSGLRPSEDLIDSRLRDSPTQRHAPHRCDVIDSGAYRGERSVRESGQLVRLRSPRTREGHRDLVARCPPVVKLSGPVDPNAESLARGDRSEVHSIGSFALPERVRPPPQHTPAGTEREDVGITRRATLTRTRGEIDEGPG
jgi:hypothetical protein